MIFYSVEFPVHIPDIANVNVKYHFIVSSTENMCIVLHENKTLIDALFNLKMYLSYDSLL